MKIGTHLIKGQTGRLTTVSWSKHDNGTEFQGKFVKWLIKNNWYWSIQNKWWQKNSGLISDIEQKSIDKALRISKGIKYDNSQKKDAGGVLSLF